MINPTPAAPALEPVRAVLARAGSLFEAVPDATVIVDESGRILLVNRQVEIVFGYAREELLGQSVEILLPARFAAAHVRHRAGFHAHPHVRPMSEVRDELFGRRKDGTEFPADINLSPLATADGTLVIATVRDVTRRRRLEQELREREKLLRSIAENVPHSYLAVVNRDLVVEFSSGQEMRVRGLDPAKFHGLTVAEIFGQYDPTVVATVEAAYRRTLDGEEQVFELRVGAEDQHYRTIPLPGEDGTIQRLLAVAENVTARKGLEAELRQAQKMEAIGQLSAGVAHDFNNILTVIQGQASMLEVHGALTAAARSAVEEIRTAAERAANLTRQLLTFSRRQAMHPRYFDLNGTVTNMARMLQRLLGEDVRMELHLAPQEVIVFADFGMIEQVLLNLAVNARDAMPHGGRLVVATTAVDLDATAAAALPSARPGRFVGLEVTDNGTGIPAHVLPRIFEPFFTTKDTGKGTGLGLATVYGIVQQHEGWIVVDSEVGQGTTFRVYLPRHTERPVEAARPMEALLRHRGSESILVVEDEPALRALISSLLGRLGYHVYTAATGPQALEMWRQYRGEIQLLLTDVIMPDGMSGFDLGAQLTAENPRLRVIYTSGYSPEKTLPHEQLVTGVNFLAKPFDLDQLMRAIRAALDAAGAE